MEQQDSDNSDAVPEDLLSNANPRVQVLRMKMYLTIATPKLRQCISASSLQSESPILTYENNMEYRNAVLDCLTRHGRRVQTEVMPLDLWLVLLPYLDVTGVRKLCCLSPMTLFLVTQNAAVIGRSAHAMTNEVFIDVNANYDESYVVKDALSAADRAGRLSGKVSMKCYVKQKTNMQLIMQTNNPCKAFPTKFTPCNRSVTFPTGTAPAKDPRRTVVITPITPLFDVVQFDTDGTVDDDPYAYKSLFTWDGTVVTPTSVVICVAPTMSTVMKHPASLTIRIPCPVATSLLQFQPFSKSNGEVKFSPDSGAVVWTIKESELDSGDRATKAFPKYKLEIAWPSGAAPPTMFQVSGTNIQYKELTVVALKVTFPEAGSAKPKPPAKFIRYEYKYKTNVYIA
eukprot:PhF_6_TR24816/c0_g1_i3/m.34166